VFDEAYAVAKFLQFTPRPNAQPGLAKHAKRLLAVESYRLADDHFQDPGTGVGADGELHVLKFPEYRLAKSRACFPAKGASFLLKNAQKNFIGRHQYQHAQHPTQLHHYGQHGPYLGGYINISVLT
jgi:hypothetical protein